MPIGCADCPLVREDFFCSFDARDFSSWSKRSRSVSVRAREGVYERGKPATGVYVVCTGQVKTISRRGDDSFVSAIHDPGSLLGVRDLVQGHLHRDRAIALANASVRFLSAKDFKQILQGSRSFAARVMSALADESSKLEELRWVCSADAVRARLARLLLSFSRARKGSTCAPLLLSRREIAEIIGSSRETVTRKVAELRALGVVETGPGYMLVVDRPALARIAL